MNFICKLFNELKILAKLDNLDVLIVKNKRKLKEKNTYLNHIVEIKFLFIYNLLDNNIKLISNYN